MSRKLGAIHLKLGIQALPHSADTCISHQCHSLLLVNRARYTDATGQKVERNPYDRQKVALSLASHGLGLLTSASDTNESGPLRDGGPAGVVNQMLWLLYLLVMQGADRGISMTRRPARHPQYLGQLLGMSLVTGD